MHNMYRAPRRTVAPTDYAVTLDDAKFECRIFTSDFDEQIRRLMWAATERVEGDTNLCFMTQTWQVAYDCFPCDGIEIPNWPVQSLTFIKYYTSEVLTTLSSSDYQTDLRSAPCRIIPVSGESWPTVDTDTLNAVQLEWIAGYATKALVPRLAQDAILYVVGNMFRGEPLCDTYWTLISGLKKFDVIR